MAEPPTEHTRRLVHAPPPAVPPTAVTPRDPRASEIGARLAARTARGEFQALSLGGASVMLNLVPTAQHGRRVERWFDALQDARA